MELREPIMYDELIMRCKQGDSSAYTSVYHIFSKEIYNTIYRLVNETTEAEDLLQETFMAVFNGIDRFDITGSFRAWIKRIAINKAISRLRKRKIRFAELDTSHLKANEETVDEQAFEFRVAEVNRAIEALPDSYRTIVQLHIFENIPHVEIAVLLGLEPNNVRIQYHRARQRILKALTTEVNYE